MSPLLSSLTSSRLTLADIEVLENLEAKIDRLLKGSFAGTSPTSVRLFSLWIFEGKSAFLRLCGRSPKDADTLDPEAVIREYETNLSQLIKEGHPDDPNTQFMYLIFFSRPQSTYFLF